MKEITLGNRKVTVHTLKTRDSGKVERMRREAREVPRTDADEQVLVEVFYPILYYCSDGDLPTADEFLDMPLTQSNEWFAAVDEENPGLLPIPEVEGSDKEERDAKKGSSQTK